MKIKIVRKSDGFGHLYFFMVANAGAFAVVSDNIFLFFV